MSHYLWSKYDVKAIRHKLTV